MELQTIVPALLCMAAIIIIAIGLARVAEVQHLSRRFEDYVPRPGGLPPAGQTRRPGPLVGGVERALIRRGRHNDIARELARADLLLTPAEYVMLLVLMVIAAFFLGMIIFKVIYVAVPFSLLGYLAPRWYLRFRQARREALFSAQLPNALTLLANSLRSGYSLMQGIDLMSKEMSPPISVEFGRVVREMGLGVALEPALHNLTRRMDNDDLSLLVTVMLVNHELGGNLATVLDSIAHTIRERVRIKGEIRTLTTQQQTSGYFVGSLPFFLSVVLFILNPSYMGSSFQSLCGQAMFATAFIFVGIAFILIRKIVSLEV